MKKNNFDYTILLLLCILGIAMLARCNTILPKGGGYSHYTTKKGITTATSEITTVDMDTTGIKSGVSYTRVKYINVKGKVYKVVTIYSNTKF